ncbi:MAG: ATP-binding protein [Candidatus Micrarchaeota archaeon]|nr:ATP-binding protein [Candidatus Micrarchaeota archaeon]
MEIEVLIDQNPWWKDRKLIEKDYDILKWKSKKYRWVPKIVDEITLEPFSLHMITGPRQAGKTTAIKLLIRKLLKKVEPESVFYFNCEELKDYRELIGVLEAYSDFRRGVGIKNSFIFLDEITSPVEWYRGIKSLIEKGRFLRDVVVLTGSSSVNIKKHTELFPGRRGKGKNFVLLPLSFREFVRVMRPEIYKKIKPVKNLRVKDLLRASLNALVFKKELNELLETYLRTGGFPLGIENIEEAKRTYLSWIKTEILKSGRSITVAREIIKALLEKLQTPVSWEGISKEIEIKSPKTVSTYVELFRSMFSAVVLHHVDIASKTLKFGKNKKIHFIDPLLFYIFEEWCITRIRNPESALAESVVAVHLARYFAKKHGRSELDEGIGYWRNSSEVDVILLESTLKGFEVKWSDKFEIKEPKGLKEFVVISKNSFSENPPVIPLSVFLSVLEA